MNRLYLGIGRNPDGTLRRIVFRSDLRPETVTHGHLYSACVGPFRTRRGAEFARVHGLGNPHCRSVADAERLARKYAP